MNTCPYCHEPVAKQGYTCDRDCYTAWAMTWSTLPTGDDGLIILPDDENVPLTLHLQPWWLAEFDDDVKPKVEFKDGIVLKPVPFEVEWRRDASNTISKG